MGLSTAEYIWLDGAHPTQELRSKTRVLELSDPMNPQLSEFPEWSYDGSSTYQASGDNSDLVIRAVRAVKDPIRGSGNWLVMCEVLNSDGTPHSTNTRSLLRHVLDNGGTEEDPWFGYEQEYTLFEGRNPMGWPENGYPKPQGPFYCGVGADRVFGRDVVEAHTKACIDAGIMIYGINAEVMPGQWEFQVGYRGVKSEKIDALQLADDQQLARWLLHRIAEDHGVTVSLDNKPVKGDWNGAGCHTNFSTRSMRSKETGKQAIEQAIERLGNRHDMHVQHYGAGLADRLTGLHETCSIEDFRAGVSDRGCSIRIPLQVHQNGYGYIEDRRPGANMDPYLVSALLVSTVCGIAMPESTKEGKAQPALV